MKVIHSQDDPCSKTAVGDIASGEAVLNGEGNLCLVCRSTDLDGLVRMVNLENGGTYTVKRTCMYEVVKATTTWARK